jgi:hypothetical protein
MALPQPRTYPRYIEPFVQSPDAYPRFGMWIKPNFTHI